ncbi:MAG: class I SAM-dependent methyltransferase [Magnetococcales bacterium]|nr:class I SAM-dependent methyltransferase [Magnetococcales bacterium]MBF0321827.1 class I SAM-dependent methyltransferase [Magnetococcales bacterium]
MRCRLCGYNNLTMFLDLGYTALADRFMTLDQLREPEVTYPLRVLRCNECNFVQLDHIVDPKILYQEEYPYESSTTRTGRSHFDAFADSVIKEFGIAPGGLVIDIGSNVGVLLTAFKKRGMQVLGIDPAGNIAQIAEKNGIPTLVDFFNMPLAQHIVAGHGRAKIATASNVFAHIDDLTALMRAIKLLLDDDGIFIVEAPYLDHLIQALEYDTIYHEHLSYLSVTPLVRFFQRMDMELFDVQQVDIHGGSIRFFVGHPGRHVPTRAVHDTLARERDSGLHTLARLNDFAGRVKDHRDKLRHLIHALRRQGKRIAGVSAPAKGMTLLNYCKIGSESLEFLTEKTPLKIGRFAPGNHLPVLPDEALVSEGIDYALLLAWNFKAEIMENLMTFRENGGKFIVPIPEPLIV